MMNSNLSEDSLLVLLKLINRFGVLLVVVMLTGVSVFLSIAFAMGYLFFFPTPHCEDVLMLLSTIIPAVVAPVVSYPYVQTIREVDRLRARVTALARYDPLTQVLNRRFFSEMAVPILQRAMRCKEPVALMFVDADFFKKVNDEYGHAAGDAVLKALAAQLRQLTRDYDLVGRYGGEEFLLLLPQAAPEQAARIAERIRSHIECTPIDTGAETISVTVSIGLTCQCSDELTLDSLTEKADQGVYAAKEAGRNCVRCVDAVA